MPPRHLTAHVPAPGVRVVRFTRTPPPGGALGDAADEGGLCREMHEAALADLRAGEALVLSLGGLRRFTSDVYRMLLGVRREAVRRQGRLLLCELSPEARHVCDVLHAGRLFHFADTEAEAVRLAAAQAAAQAAAGNEDSTTRERRLP